MVTLGSTTGRHYFTFDYFVFFLKKTVTLILKSDFKLSTLNMCVLSFLSNSISRYFTYSKLSNFFLSCIYNRTSHMRGNLLPSIYQSRTFQTFNSSYQLFLSSFTKQNIIILSLIFFIIQRGNWEFWDICEYMHIFHIGCG